MITLEDLAASLQDDEGVHVNRLPEGTDLEIKTKNSTYFLKTTSHNDGILWGGTLRDGGTRFPHPTIVKIVGSTWGGSTLRLNWVGLYMYMEIYWSRKTIRTGPVRFIKIRFPDGTSRCIGPNPEKDHKWNQEGF